MISMQIIDEETHCRNLEWGEAVEGVRSGEIFYT